MRGSALPHEQLQELLDAPLGGEGAPTVADVENKLTDGYAHALALDAERSRLAKRIGALAALEGADAEEKARELSSLSQRLAQADVELSSLRRTLAKVRRRANKLRSDTALV
jgi:hypothetical protein